MPLRPVWQCVRRLLLLFIWLDHKLKHELFWDRLLNYFPLCATVTGVDKEKVGLRGTIELEDQILRCCDSSDDVIERWWSSLVFSWWSLLSFRLVWYWMSDGIAFVRCDWFIASAWHDLYWVIPFIVGERVELKQFDDLICAVHHWDRCDVVLDVCCYCSCDWITSLSKSCSGTDCWITLHCAPLRLMCSYVRLLPLL